MKSAMLHPTRTRSRATELSARIGRGLVLLVAATLMSGCFLIEPEVQYAPNPHTDRGVPQAQRKIMVFLDGTANEWGTRTNVRRLFEIAAAAEDPRRMCCYIDGVGKGGRLIGKATGLGMRSRVREAYKYLDENYRDGDEIYIFGFSRGAHEARTLTGIISFCGLVARDAGRDHSHIKKRHIEAIFDLCEEIKDEVETRADFLVAQAACIGQIKEKLKLECKPVPIRFLGIWDTVPGSLFTKFNDIRQIGDDKGTRYKMRPYPAIVEVAHALSIDEKRSKFKPVRMGPKFKDSKTVIHEVWFPGAHSDVGGGYEDSNDLAGVSLNWMLEILGDHGVLKGIRVYADPEGIQHYPMKSTLSSLGSDRVDRTVPPKAILHWSFQDRLKGEDDYLPRWANASWKLDTKPSTDDIKTHKYWPRRSQ